MTSRPAGGADGRVDGPSFSVGNRAARQLWMIASFLVFRFTPRPLHAWRRLVLRLFGARIGQGAHIYAGARIWAPWNLSAGRAASIADGAEVYNPSPVALGEYAIVSQGAYLCGASHQYDRWDFPLVSGPITIGAHAWVAARAIVHMNVVIGEGCVIAAGSIVTHDMPAWTVCAGAPCRPLRPYTKQ